MLSDTSSDQGHVPDIVISSAIDTQTRTGVVTESTPLLAATNIQVNPEIQDRPLVFSCVCFLAALISTLASMVALPGVEVIRYIVCQDYYSGTTDLNIINLASRFEGKTDKLCAIDAISKQVSTFVGTSSSLDAGTAILVILLYGKLADVYGRKLPLSIAITGLMTSLAVFALITNHASEWGISPLFIAYAISGLSGGSPAFRMILSSMVCDCYAGSSRLVAMSYLSASIGLGVAIGPAIGSWLLTKGLLWPIWTTVAGALLCLIICVAMPETRPSQSLSEDIIRNERTMLTNDESLYAVHNKSSSTIFSMGWSICKSSLLTLAIFARGRNFAILGFVSFVLNCGNLTFLYVAQYLEHSFNWSLAKSGYLLAMENFGNILVLLVLVPIFTKWISTKTSGDKVDLVLVRIGLILLAIVYFGYAFMPTVKILPLIIGLHTLAAPARVSLRVLISNLVPTDEVGSIFAAVSVLDGIGELVAPPVLGLVYASTLSTFAGAIFLLLAFSVSIGFLASCAFKHPNQEETEQISTEV